MADINLLSKEVIAQLKFGFEQLKKRHENLGDTAPYVKALADRGWFINWSHTPRFTMEAFEFVKNKHNRKVDRHFESYYTQFIPEIEGRLKRIYPEAKPMLQQAFKCYHGKMYYASIPLIFMLSEYIANKAVSRLTKKPVQNMLFNSKNGQYIIFDIIGELVKANNGIFNINKPLIVEHLLNKRSWGQISTNPADLSRHLILHGNHSKYGTRLNNLKAVSFLEFIDLSIRYLGWIEESHKEKQPEG